MPSHNKKRNVGLLYEFLVRTVSDAIVENDEKRKNIGLSILKNHFKKDSELYKEFRLFHALAATTVTSASVADTILESAKDASEKYNCQKLDREKSLLIRDINHQINDSNFYNQSVKEYTIYATIQTLLNEWRQHIPNDIVKVAEYEETLKEWLRKEKEVETLDASETSDPLVEKLMIKKFNERYGNTLTGEQRDIIKTYMFSSDKVDSKLQEVKDSALVSIEKYLEDASCKKNKYVSEKLTRAKNVVLAMEVKADDETVEKFLDIAKLVSEIRGE